VYCLVDLTFVTAENWQTLGIRWATCSETSITVRTERESYISIISRSSSSSSIITGSTSVRSCHAFIAHLHNTLDTRDVHSRSLYFEWQCIIAGYFVTQLFSSKGTVSREVWQHSYMCVLSYVILWSPAAKPTRLCKSDVAVAVKTVNFNLCSVSRKRDQMFCVISSMAQWQPAETMSKVCS